MCLVGFVGPASGLDFAARTYCRVDVSTDGLGLITKQDAVNWSSHSPSGLRADNSDETQIRQDYGRDVRDQGKRSQQPSSPESQQCEINVVLRTFQNYVPEQD